MASGALEGLKAQAREQALIAIRFILKLIAANPANPFTQGVYAVSWVFAFPFSGVVPNVNIGAGAVIEFFSLIAILVYVLASIALAKRMRFPDLSLNVQYSQQAGTDVNAAQPPTLSFGIIGTFPLFYFQAGEIKKAEADYRTQQLQRAKVEAQLVSDVEAAMNAFISSRKLVERMEARVLDRSKRARDLVALQYQKGAASLLEYLDANRTFIANNVEYLQDLANYWTAVYQLEAAVGMDLR